MLRESEDAVPPIWLPSVPELERDAPMARDEVAVEYTTPELPARRPERLPIEKLDVKRLVELAVVAKKDVVVALVPVAFANVKF